ncbi:MAG: GDSL-type esterase/lipase family protein [Schleiferiaceae bacterium]
MNRQSPWMTLAVVSAVLALVGAVALLPEAWRPELVKLPTWDLSAWSNVDDDLRVVPEPADSAATEDPSVANSAPKTAATGVGLLEFPEGDSLGFQKFAMALRRAETGVVRVLHYGDSQIEGDRLSADVRGMLQNRFGGMGPGLQGMDPFVPMASVDHRASGNWKRYACFGRPSDREPRNLYGVRGIAHRYEGLSASMEFRNRNYGYEKVRTGQKLTLYLGPYEGPAEVKVYYEDSLAHIRYYAQGDPGVMEFKAPRPMSRVRVEFKGDSPLCYGAAWDGLRGVAVDNVSMRGADGLGFKRIDADHYRSALQQANPGLVILQFGGNAVPYFKSAAEVARYGRAFARQIAAIQKALPEADVLVIGPSDMAHKVGTEWESYPFVDEVRDALREAAHVQGAAFFDVYAFMGGAGSMTQWVGQNPPLAGADHIHFTPNGAQRVGKALAAALSRELDRHAE